MRPEVHLGTLLRTGEDVHLEGELSELHYLQGNEPQTLTFAHPAAYRADINSVGGDDMYLQGFFRPTVVQECARCLRPVEVPLDLKLGIMLRYEPGTEEPYIEEADGEELLMFGDVRLDLSAYMAETTLLSLPLVVLHDPACLGLCQVCGHDLNEGPCEHSAAVPVEPEEAAAAGAAPTAAPAKDNPFAALRDLNLPDLPDSEAGADAPGGSGSDRGSNR